MDRAVELGLTFWDSADIYGDSEVLIGRWFARDPSNRAKIFLATKFGINTTGVGSATRGDPEYVRACVRRSIARLGIDRIDLYYMHRPDPTTPIEVTVRVLKELQDEGIIGHIGLSECDADTLRRAAAVTQIAAYQVEYSPFFTDIETSELGILAAARENGIAIVPYSPLGRGLLTGKYKSIDDFDEDDFRRKVPRYSDPENFAKLLALVDRLRAMADAKGVTPGQLTLAWIIAQGPDFVPIPGTSRIANLEENRGSLDVELTANEVADIRAAIGEADVSGLRYPEG